MTAEERTAMLTMANASHIAVLTLGKVLKATNEASLEYESYQLHDLAEQIRIARDAVFSEEEVKANIEPMLHGRFTEYLKKNK